MCTMSKYWWNSYKAIFGIYYVTLAKYLSSFDELDSLPLKIHLQGNDKNG